MITGEIKFEAKRMGILLLLTLFGCALFLLRGVFVGERQYSFVFWNLFLAWVPYGVSCAMLFVDNYVKSKQWLPALIPFGVMWLMFFPNAPYMLTTYAHFSWVGLALLNQTASFEFEPWYDFVLFSSVTFSGLFAGAASLQIVHGIIEKHFSKTTGWASVVAIIFLSSWAIYLGRFVRLNSWDLLTNPGVLLTHIFLDWEKIFFIFLLGVLLLFMYIILHSFCERKKEIAQ